jgi:phosphoglycerol transferase MdoB-like AlkP superfamily enzyme
LKNRILFILKYCLFWLLLFQVLRAVFIVYNYAFYNVSPIGEILKSFIYGSKLDVSFTAYLSILPFIIISISFFFDREILFKKIIMSYSMTLIIIITLLSLIDFELYKWWGFRLDATVLKYINTPREMMASSEVAPVFLLITLFFFIISGMFVVYVLLLYPHNKSFEKTSLLRSVIGFLAILVITASLIIPIRGGLQLAPMNESAAFFSTNPLLNNTAVNVPWNFIHSILEKNYETQNPYINNSESKVSEIIKQLYAEPGRSKKILRERPNVIVIIWESFTAKVVKETGGKDKITPQFSRLIKEGILFDNIYASGDRSDKGLIAILAGYPSQPTKSIITNPGKAIHLPAISTELKNNGYNTSFYYGGELEFANIKSFLLNHNYDKLTSKSDFEEKYWNSKWGAHDEIVLDRQFEDLNNEKQPFFSTIFTLSSHEPFEIPIPPLLPGTDWQTLFLNSMHYTDQCIGKFIEKAKKTSWWNNTVIIIIADHGHAYPSESGVPMHVPAEFHIPMLWLGGALNTSPNVNQRIGSQTDLANTLLHQMDIYTQKFPFSKDLMNPESVPFAYYSFNNGFGFIKPGKRIVIDNISGKVMFQEGQLINSDMEEGKAYLQYSFQDYLNK